MRAIETRDEFSAVNRDAYQYILVDLHDIVTDLEKKERLLPELEGIIRSQAGLHRAKYEGDIKSLEENIWAKGHTFRGFLVYAEGMPIAYSIYYPMVDGEGRRAAYCEDAHVVEGFRQGGVFDIVLSELARRVIDEGCEYLQWSTDKRNDPFLAVSKHIGAKQPGILTLTGDSLLDTANYDHNLLSNGWSEGNFNTRPITPSDINLLKSLKVDPNFIRKTGDMDFRGFITFRKSEPRKPVAIVPGWEHLSTFKMSPGLVLEHPSFDASIKGKTKVQVLLSVIRAANAYTAQKDKNMSYLKWHIKEDDAELLNILKDKMKLPIDCMMGPNRLESQLITHTLSNGSLQKMADKAADNATKIFYIPYGQKIGRALRQASPN